jgi:hypothetical protein
MAKEITNVEYEKIAMETEGKLGKKCIQRKEIKFLRCRKKVADKAHEWKFAISECVTTQYVVESNVLAIEIVVNKLNKPSADIERDQ